MEATMRIADSVIAELDLEAPSTRRVLERIPEDKLSWRPHPKSMSLGQLALHIASVPGGVARIAAPDTIERPTFTQVPEATSKAEVLESFERSLVAAKEFLRGLDDERAEATWAMQRDGKTIMAMPRIAFIRMVMLRHIYHHRGEMCVYLRLLGVPVPSVYGPSADENPFA